MGVKEILVFLILFGANLLQAITGFAGTLISMQPTMKLIVWTKQRHCSMQLHRFPV